MVGLAPSTMLRKVATRTKLNVNQSERVLGLARLIGQVEAVVGGSRRRHGFHAAMWVAQWLNVPQPSLADWRPRDLMDTDVGRQLVFSAVARMQSGVYS